MTTETLTAPNLESIELPEGGAFTPGVDEGEFYLPVDDEAPAPGLPIIGEAYLFIGTAEEAEAVVDQLASFDERVARLDANFKRLTERYQAQKVKLQKQKEGYEAIALEPLRRWAEANRPATSKSIKLLSGTIAFKSEPATFVLADKGKDELTEWAKVHAPAFVETKTVLQSTLDTNGLKKHLLADIPKAPVPGFIYRPASEKMTVKGA